MKLSDQAAAHFAARAQKEDQDHERMLVRVHDTAMARKRVVYWIGFLEGALASRAIEPGEGDAILAEARRFQEFFEDPDASDLVEDLAGNAKLRSVIGTVPLGQRLGHGIKALGSVQHALAGGLGVLQHVAQTGVQRVGQGIEQVQLFARVMNAGI